jgi:alpha-galactosidase
VQGGNAADGTPIILWPCSGMENERWFFRGNRIVGLGGKCLNVQGGDADGTPIILWPCSGTPNEVWRVRQ